MIEKLRKCPVCDHNQFDPFLDCQDYTVSQETFTIVECKNCGFRFTNPRPDEENIAKYYASEDYISHSDTNKGFINQLYQIARHYTLRNKLRLVNKLHRSIGQEVAAQRILDYGCGTGSFLEVCYQNAWEVKGLEPDPKARELASRKTQTPIWESLPQDLAPSERFEVITLWHVLEHVHQLRDTLDQLRSLLIKDGFLVIALPNSKSRDAAMYSRFWAAYDVPRHLYHFSPDTFGTLLQRHQLRIVKKLPMFLDAYYISLLSERYENQSTNYIQAIWNGFRSNQWARKHESNYSSLTYLVQKL